MKQARKSLCVITALVLCFAFPLSVSASTTSKAAGRYGTLTGTSTQANPFLSVTGKVTDNDDNAYISVSAIIYTTDGTLLQETHQSSRGVTTFTYKYPLYISLDSKPTAANCSEGIQGGSLSPIGYVVYTYTTFSF